MKNLANGIGALIIAFALVTIAALVLAWPIQWLWNTCLVPAVSAVNPIGFWQALGLNVLFSILFSSSIKNNQSGGKSE